MSNLTKNALANSFKSLLSIGATNKITISDIVENCKLNRQTFYYHFQDIYALLDYLFERETEEITQKKLSYDHWESCLNSVFEYIEGNKKFIANVYRSFGLECIEQCLYKVQIHQLDAVIDDFDCDKKIEAADRDFISRFVAYAIVGMCLQWIREGMKEDYQLLTAKAARLLNGDIAKFF